MLLYSRFFPVLLLCLPLMMTSCGPIEPLPDTHMQTPEPPILTAPQIDTSESAGAPVASWGNPDEEAIVPANMNEQIVHESGHAEAASVPAAPVSPVETIELRVARLENDVGALRQEMQLILPELRQLISQRQHQASVAHPKPSMVATKIPQKVVQETVSKGPAKLIAIRAGEHPGKSRLVLDTGVKTPFSYDLDNAEKILIIELPAAQLSGTSLAATLSQSTLIQSYASEATDKGSRVIVQLKQAAKVTASEIGAGNGKGNRIVFDLSVL